MAGKPGHEARAGADEPVIDWAPVRVVVDWGVRDEVFPGAVVEAGRSAGVLWRDAIGRFAYDGTAAPVTVDTVYDLASLTKVLATATVAMYLTDRGRLDLDRQVAAHVSEWSLPDRRAVTIRDLLTHASGLPGWMPLHQSCRGIESVVSAICRTPLAYTPRSQSLYSDLGFILLGHILEDVTGTRLDAASGQVWAAMGTEVVSGLSFRPPADWVARTAPARRDDERGVISPGDVDDTNAWALGGVAGHAGMFGVAAGVGAFARTLLWTRAGHGPAGFVDARTLTQFITRSDVPRSSRALGWDTMVPTSSCGGCLSPRSFGHTGFTGTSLWIDPDADLYVVLLSNRVHPRAAGPDGIQLIRRAVHDAVVRALRRA
jgi:CubicO group peptidase (beta-lactamase class C family)